MNIGVVLFSLIGLMIMSIANDIQLDKQRDIADKAVQALNAYKSQMHECEVKVGNAKHGYKKCRILENQYD